MTKVTTEDQQEIPYALPIGAKINDNDLESHHYALFCAKRAEKTAKNFRGLLYFAIPCIFLLQQLKS